ncbi:MAG: CsgG/HfaB family protein [Acidobacteriota bacterium]|nr:CsgG/HfaB family protein [Acidobacteriota bacterium]
MKVRMFLTMVCWLTASAWSGGLNIANRKTLRLDHTPVWGAFNGDDSRALVLDARGNLYLIDPVSGNLLKRENIGGDAVLADASIDLDILAAISDKGSLVVFRTGEATPVARARIKLKRRERPVGLQYNAAHRQVIALTSNGAVNFISENGQARGRVVTSKRAVACTLDHDGKRLFVFHENGSISTVDTLRKIAGSTFNLGTAKEELKVKAVALSKCERVPLVAVGLDRFDKRILSNRNLVFSSASDVNFANAYLDEVRIFSLKNNLVEKTLDSTSFRDEITGLSFGPDGLWVASIHAVRKKVKLWDVKISVEGSQLESDQVPGFIDFSRRGNFLMFGNTAGTLTILSLEGVAPCGSDSYTANFREKGKLKIPNAREVSIALLPFDVEGTSIEVGRTVTRLVETTVAMAPNVTLADRSDLDRVAGELKIQNTGITDTSTAARIGKMLNVRYLLMGTLTRFGEKVILMLKLVEVETAKIVGTRGLTCNRCGDSQIPDAVERLCMGLFEVE